MTVSNDDDGNAFVTHKKPYLNVKSKAATDYPSRPVKFKVTELEEVIETQDMFTEVIFSARYNTRQYCSKRRLHWSPWGGEFLNWMLFCPNEALFSFQHLLLYLDLRWTHLKKKNSQSLYFCTVPQLRTSLSAGEWNTLLLNLHPVWPSRGPYMLSHTLQQLHFLQGTFSTIKADLQNKKKKDYAENE